MVAQPADLQSTVGAAASHLKPGLCLVPYLGEEGTLARECANSSVRGCWQDFPPPNPEYTFLSCGGLGN